MANRKTKYSKPSKKSRGLKYDIRFDFMKKAFIIMNGKKLVGDKLFKNIHEAVAAILEDKF